MQAPSPAGTVPMPCPLPPLCPPAASMLGLALCVGLPLSVEGKGSRKRQEQDAMIPPQLRKCLLLWPACHRALLDRAIVCPCCKALSPQETGAVTAKHPGTEEPQHPPPSARRAKGRVQLKIKKSKNSHLGMCSPWGCAAPVP